LPSYEFACPDGHEFEIYCSISKYDPAPTCACGAVAHRAFRTPPTLWIVGQTHNTVLDTPGAKANKAGYVHSHGDKPSTKVQSGFGGMSRPELKYRDEVADWVKPDGTKGTAPGETS